MKKNFMAIASLLIAAMLLVVSCAPEAKIEDDGLVNASFSVAYGKDVVVKTNPGVTIDYTYSLTPEWTTLENGVEPFGKVENAELALDKGIGVNFTVKNLGRVTPGLWKIEVVGKLHGTDTVVMKGSTKAHFRNANTSSTNSVSAITSATVYVAPVNNVDNGTLHISIKMEDLGDPNANKISYSLDGADSIPLNRSTSASGNVYTYTEKDPIDNVKSGYHFITFTVDGYEGGVTKSFLMLPGTGSTATTGVSDVKITGSVVPSKFATTGASIEVISIPDKAITVGPAGNTKTFDGDPNKTYAPLTVTALSVPVSIDEYTNEAGLKLGNAVATPSYTWYVNGEEYVSLNTNSGNITIDNDPGDYTITCVIKLTFDDVSGGQYTIYGHEKQAAVVRLEKKVATTTPSQGN